MVVRFTVGLDKAVYEAVKADAEKNKRSLSAQIAFLTELHYQEQVKKEKKRETASERG
jgi:hypothetical protein